MEPQVLAMLRNQLADIILGTMFLFIGLTACSIAAIRRRSGGRLFIWLGIWSAMYGAGLLTQSRAVVAALPYSIQITVPYVNTAVAYLTVVVGLSAFLELSLGRVRLLIQILIFAGMAVALAGIGWFVSGDQMISSSLTMFSSRLAVFLSLYLLLPSRNCPTGSWFS